MPRTGLIGVGHIGKHFVDSIREADHLLTVYDIDPDQVAYAMDRGAESAENPAGVGRASDVVLISVPGSPEVETVMEGDDGLLAGLSAGDLVIDTTTEHPATAVRYERECTERDIGFVSSPLTRIAPTPGLSLMVGGTQENYDRAREVLDVIAGEHTRIGRVDESLTFKLMLQLRYLGHEAVDAEVVAFGRDMGLDPGLMNSFLDLDIPERLLEEDFSAAHEGMGGLRTWHKDLGYLLDVARENDTATPLASVFHEIYKSAVRSATSEERNSTTILRHWQRLNGRE